jgi:DNA polymerase III delta prime subunit
LQCSKCWRTAIRVGSFFICELHGQLEPEGAINRSVDLLPYTVASVVSEYAREANPFLKLHRLADSVEIITRFMAVVILSDHIRQNGQFGASLQKVLVEKIERPSFGAWREILDAGCRTLPKRRGKPVCFVQELPAFINETFLGLLGQGGADPRQAIIPFRNLLAHGGRLSEAEAGRFLADHAPRFDAMVEDLGFLSTYPLIASTPSGPLLLRGAVPERFAPWTVPDGASGEMTIGHIYLASGAVLLDLAPVHVFATLSSDGQAGPAPSVPQLYFRRSARTYIDFTAFSEDASFSQQGDPIAAQFQSLFSLDQWQRQSAAERQRKQLLFTDVTASLTDVFVGREGPLAEVKALLKSRTAGVLWLAGPPGIGKSAMMARLTRDLVSGQSPLVIPYFFGRGNAVSTSDFFKAALLHLQMQLGTEPLIPLDSGECRAEFWKALHGVSQQSKIRLVFLVDGFDEICLQEPNFLDVPFHTQLPRVVWLCAGRSEAALDGAMLSRGATSVFPQGLPRLDESAIRAMLVTHLDRQKYEVFARDSADGGRTRNRFVEVMARKSEGLPLYVEMVVRDIQKRRITLTDEDRLPEGINAYYDQILRQLQVDSAGSVLTAILCALCWAKEALTEPVLNTLLSGHHLARTRHWNGTFRRALDSGSVLLRSIRTPEGEAAWTIYHGSFRQFLEQAPQVAADREWAAQNGTHWCSEWSRHRHPYALRHYAAHLVDADRWPEVYHLSRDEEFRDIQAKALFRDPDASPRTVRLALTGAIAHQEIAGIAEFTLSLVRRRELLSSENPLITHRNGHPERSAMLIGLRPPGSRFLWKLLLACELGHAGRVAEAESLLSEPLPSPLLRYSGSDGLIAGYLLFELYTAMPQYVLQFQDEFLSDYGKVLLVSFLDKYCPAVAPGGITSTIDDEDLLELFRSLCSITNIDRRVAVLYLSAVRDFGSGMRDNPALTKLCPEIAERIAAHDLAEAWQLNEQVGRDEILGLGQDMQAYGFSALAFVEGAAGEKAEAYQRLADLLHRRDVSRGDAGAVANALSEIGLVLASHGEAIMADTLMAAAESRFDRAWEEARNIPVSERDDKLYFTSVASNRLKLRFLSGDDGGFREKIMATNSDGVREVDGEDTMRVLTDLLNRARSGEEVTELRDLAARTRREEPGWLAEYQHTVHLVPALGKALARVGAIQDARELFAETTEMIADGKQDHVPDPFYALNQVAVAQYVTRESQDVRNTLARLHILANSANPPHLRARRLASVAATGSRVGEVEFSRQLLDVSVELARSLPSHLSDEALSSIAIAEAEMENYSATYEILSSLPGNDWEASGTYGLVSLAMAGKGNMAEALRCMNQCVFLPDHFFQQLASITTDRRDKDSLLHLFPFLTGDLETALKACVLLASLFPESASKIAELIAR